MYWKSISWHFLTKYTSCFSFFSEVASSTFSHSLNYGFLFVSDSSLSLLTSLFISASSHPPLPLSVDIRCTSLSHSKDICNANERNIRKSTLTSFQTHPPLDTLFLHPLSYYFHTLQPPPPLFQNSAIAKWYWKGKRLETLRADSACVDPAGLFCTK